METRQIGIAGLEATEIGLGTNAVGGHNLYDDLSEENGIALVRRAVELGVSFIDTADIYGMGRSEELVGKALGHNKYDVLVATKGANEWDDKGRVGVNNDPKYLRKALENSLKRLNRDYVDLYYIHAPDPEHKFHLAKSFEELLKLKEEGKIKSAGVSNFSLEQLKEAIEAGPVEALQSQYNIFNRDVEQEILPFCEEQDVSFVPWGPLAFGLLGGKYTRDFKLTEGDWRNNLPLFAEENFKANLDIADELKKLADERGVPLAHLALRWLLRKPVVKSVIVGAKRPDQVDDNVGAVGWDLTQQELDRIDELTG